MLKYFRSSLIFTLLAITLGYFIAGWQGAIICLILGVLEVSLSFDNAVVNAKVLETMTTEWRHRFITWGIAIAVFGMRLVFPLLIVGVTASLSPIEVLQLAIAKPQEYQHHLEAAHVEIMGYGGTFLFMVFWKYFADETKDVHWLALIERPLTELGKIEAVQVALTLFTVYVTTKFLPADKIISFWVASVFGLITYIAADGLGVILGGEEDEDNTVGKTIQRAGLASFMYLELLDASFSFDGVVGAFALSDNIFIIAIGLGIGAMFVRSLTLMLVDLGTLSEYRYLEHGAFYSIGSLAVIMFLNTVIEVPEIVTGSIAAVLIALSFGYSVYVNYTEPKEETDEFYPI
ncbi:MAG: DUF475 domain-containing protein [Candidatus Nitrosotenuis sp.]